MTATPPLRFRLDASTGVPFYRQVIDQVLLGVADGRLRAGEQLPTVRQLAVDLSVNLNTVAKAYREMEIRGIVQTQQGTGTFVGERRPEGRAAERKKALDRLVEETLVRAASKGFTEDETVRAFAERASARTARRER
jgi:GntR family transcriptional regulator